MLVFALNPNFIFIQKVKKYYAFMNIILIYKDKVIGKFGF